MATTGQVSWKKIKKMLSKCTEEWWYKDKQHKRWIYAEGKKTPFMMQMGAHGAKNPEIEIGELRGLTRHFDIIECGKKHLEQLR